VAHSLVKYVTVQSVAVISERTANKAPINFIFTPFFVSLSVYRRLINVIILASLKEPTNSTMELFVVKCEILLRTTPLSGLSHIALLHSTSLAPFIIKDITSCYLLRFGNFVSMKPMSIYSQVSALY
jgi:hypothetical protein